MKNCTGRSRLDPPFFAWSRSSPKKRRLRNTVTKYRMHKNKCPYKVSCSYEHRISTARKEKGWGRHFFHQIEPIWPLPPYSTVPVPRLREARPAGWVAYWGTYMREYNAESPKQGRKRSILLWRRFTVLIFLLFIYAYESSYVFLLSVLCLRIILVMNGPNTWVYISFPLVTELEFSWKLEAFH